MHISKLLLLCCAMLLLAVPGSATEPARFFEHNGKTLLSIQTPYGPERFVFEPSSLHDSHEHERHYVGYSTIRAGSSDRHSASLSRFENTGLLFFSSRRTGRPMSAELTFAESSASSSVARVRFSKVSRFSVSPCGNEAPHAPRAAPRSAKALGMYRAAALTTQPLSSPIFSPPRVVQLAVYADSDFVAIHKSRTREYIRATINAVNNLYLPALGIKVEIVKESISRSRATSSRSFNSETLLERFRLGPAANDRSPDLHHLFTGKDFSDLTIGLAYVAATCVARGEYAVGLSRNVKSALQPLVAAHEIAHGLSAVHDDEQGSLMNPAISVANNRVSEVTRRNVLEFVSQSASCLGTSTRPEVTLSVSDKTGEFQAAVVVTTTGPASCALALEAHTVRRPSRSKSRSSRTRWRPVTALSIPIQDGYRSTTKILSTPSPVALTSRRQYGFRARTDCGSGRGTSPTTRFTPTGIGVSTQSPASRASWLTQLIANFAQQAS